MTARYAHAVLRGELGKRMQRERAKRERRERFIRPVIEGMQESWRMFWVVLLNPWTWAAFSTLMLWLSLKRSYAADVMLGSFAAFCAVYSLRAWIYGREA